MILAVCHAAYCLHHVLRDSVCRSSAYNICHFARRIMPRHRYLQSVRAQPVRPFPMNYLKCSDVLFATNVANTPLDQFEAFKQQFAARPVR